MYDKFPPSRVAANSIPGSHVVDLVERIVVHYVAADTHSLISGCSQRCHVCVCARRPGGYWHHPWNHSRQHGRGCPGSNRYCAERGDLIYTDNDELPRRNVRFHCAENRKIHRTSGTSWIQGGSTLWT